MSTKQYLIMLFILIVSFIAVGMSLGAKLEKNKVRADISKIVGTCPDGRQIHAVNGRMSCD